MLTLQNLSCERGGRVLFDNLGLTLPDSSILVIRGENGSGKTTLLKTVAGLVRPHVGGILYANEDVFGEHYPEYCTIMQYISHKNAVKLQLTVKENLSFWAGLYGTKMLIPAAMAFFRLEDYTDTICSRLSAGYVKRVALARLLLGKREIWLLDEPFVNLDNDGRQRLASLIADRSNQKGIVIIASHDEVPLKNYMEINIGDFPSAEE